MGVTQSQSNVRERSKTPEEKGISIDCRGKVEIPTFCNCDMKSCCCLRVSHVASQRLNKRVMVMKAYGKVVINEEVSDKEKMLPVEDAR
jgi:hypothetical protein